MGARWRLWRGRPLVRGGMLRPCLASMTSKRCLACPSRQSSAAVNYLLYEVVCDLVPDDDDAGFGDTWVDHVVSHADQDLPAGPGRWVRLAVGLAAEEYQLGNAELEAIERVRGGVGADRDSSLVTWVAQVDRRPRAALLGDGVVALVWLRAFGW